MPEVSELRLRDMIASQPGGFARRLIHFVFAVALRLFFRRIEIADAAFVPATGPLVFVLNHPNGLIDPALIFCALPRRISFLAKSTLFRLPVLQTLLRTVEALPLYRRVDEGEQIALNLRTFSACRALLRRGRCIALFPEGVSHSAAQMMPIKTGAARIALGALSLPDATYAPTNTDAHDAVHRLPELLIVPVGLFYSSKTAFRSEALIRCGQPLTIYPIALNPADGEPPPEPVRALSRSINAALRDVTLNVADDEGLATVEKAERLYSSIAETLDLRPTLYEKFALRRRLAAVLSRTHAGGATASTQNFAALPTSVPAAANVGTRDDLSARVARYENDLAALDLRPAHLSMLAHSVGYVFRYFLLRGVVLLLLSPLAITGGLIHLPAYLLCQLAGRLFRRHGVDDIVPTVKILVAMLLMPLTWLACTGWCYFRFGWRAALAALPALIISGYVAMRSLEELYDLRGWFRAAWTLLRRRRRFFRLLLERSALQREVAQELRGTI